MPASSKTSELLDSGLRTHGGVDRWNTDQTVPTLPMAHNDRIAPARTSEALATCFATGGSRCETPKKL